MESVAAKFLIQGLDSIEQLARSLGDATYSIDSSSNMTLCERYFDTRHWDIAKAGWSFRWSSVAGAHSICLEPLGQQVNTQVKESLYQPVQEFPERPDSIPPGSIEQTLSTIVGGRLHPVLETTSQRNVLRVRCVTGQTFQLAVDQTAFDDSSTSKSLSSLRFSELLVEKREGESQGVTDLICHLRSLHRLIPSRLTNLERGLRHIDRPPPWSAASDCLKASGNEPELSSSHAPNDLEKLSNRDPAWKLLERYLHKSLCDLLLAEPWAWEGLDPEGVHRMRVATRRLRAALQAFKPVLPGLPFEELHSEFKWLAARLGAVRDLDVYLASLADYTCGIPPQELSLLTGYELRLAEARQKARDRLIGCLSSERYEKLRHDFTDQLKSKLAKGLKPRARRLCIAEAAELLISSQYEAVLSQGRAISPDSPSEELHDLRIACKRLRYLFEIFEAAYQRPIAKSIKRLKSLQELLGEYQDACVAVGDARAYAEQVSMREEHRGLLLACGQLMHSLQQTAQARRRSFSVAWERFDRHGRLKKLMDQLR